MFRLAVAAAVLAACTLVAPWAAAVTKSVINGPIHQHLERTSDDDLLCRRKGMSMNQLVMFVPTSTTAVAVYWVRATDRFVQYPGTSGCVVWKRLGQ